MNAPDTDVETSDAQFTNWMRGNLHSAAEHFGVEIVGGPHLGWSLLSISAAATRGHEPLWLRVVAERVEYAHGSWWTGDRDANAIDGITKPRVLNATEWEFPGWRRIRAELMTRMPGRPLSATDVLRHDPQLPSVWWDELRASLERLAAVPTERVHKGQEQIARRMQAVFGSQAELPVRRWETVHGDLHWANLLHPFAMLDWELWGRGPAGTDPATLYCYALLAPRTARTAWTLFADILDTDHGRVALLHVAARLLRRVTQLGEHPDLEPPLRRLAADLR